MHTKIKIFRRGPQARRVLSLLAMWMVAASPSHADNWGCEVLLCLSNPAGPMAVAECAPPISRLWKALRKPRPDPFPTCGLATGPGGSSWAELDRNYYDPCPTGTTALPQGESAVQGTSVPDNPYALANVTLAKGIGDGADQYPTYGDFYQPMPQKVCVAGYVGAVTITRGDLDGGYVDTTVGIYHQVVTLDAAASPDLVKVFVDDRLNRTVRY
jgi:hypothetical protein